MDQYPAMGTVVKEGDTINLMVSQGPDPSTVVPNDVTLDVNIPLPPTGDFVNLVVMMDGDVIWEDEYDTAMDGLVTLQVTAPAGTTKTISYFIDGVMSGSQTLTFGA